METGSFSFIPQFEDIKTCHYPDYVVRLQKQTTKSDEKQNFH